MFLETLTELDGSPFRLEPYQIRLLNDRSLFRIVNKSRQIGFSTVIAAEGFQRADTAPWLRRPYEANFVSINQKEAAAKIDIVRGLYHSIPDALKESGIKAELWTDAQNEITFGRPPYQGKLVSQPASAAIRGGRKSIYFDEFAHIRDAKKLYQAALPAITRGDSRITIISTPLGQSGLFYDIAVDPEGYPEYSRHAVPWWESRAMVRPDAFEDALAGAVDLPTIERVKLYGSDKLNAIFRSFASDIIGFQTEYEATFVDEAEAYYPWDLVISCRNSDMPVWTDWPEAYEPEGWLAIGMDLAKERDQTVITVTEIIETDGETKYVVRYIRSMQTSYDDQFMFLDRLIKKVKPNRVSIDATGVGQIFVERAKREIPHVNIEGVTFTNAKKERWATTLKSDLQLQNVEYPQHADLLRQIHGIRRTKTETNFFKFAGVHDDFFWSMVLSFYGEGRVPARISFL
ncbi:MAG TPA: terminase family protein [Gemmatimonadales bacterium]|nr:terminase family protein [Gemmatimonadales bacterium]